MLPLRLLAFVAVSICLAGSVHAAAITKQSPSLTPLLPARAAYYDSAKAGTGVAVDVGRDGFVFLTYYGYNETGAPTWHSIQGQWTPATEAQRIGSGIIGTLHEPLLYASGGQCITCDFTGYPSLNAEPYAVSVSWTSPRHLDLTIGNQSWHMDAVQYALADEQLLAGTWQLTISWDGGEADAGGTIPALTQIVTISPGFAFGMPPIPTSVWLDPAADPSIALPPAGSNYYRIATTTLCHGGPAQIGTYGAAFADVFSAVKMSSLFANYPPATQYLAPMLWYDAGARRGGLDVVTQAMGIDTVPLALGPNNIHFDVYVEPDRVIGHGVVQGENLKAIPAAFWQPDTVALNLVMQRLPDGLVERSIYPCMLY